MTPSPERLEAMKYRDLQKVAKEIGVKANLARPLLIQKILEAAGPAKKCVPRRSSGARARSEVPNLTDSEDEDSDTPEGKEADKQLRLLDQEIRKKRARSLDENNNVMKTDRRHVSFPIF